MEFRFNLPKTLSAVGVLLSQEPNHRLNYMKLLKLLYLADRELLAETGRTITGDRVVAMERGPVLSFLCNLIRGSIPQPPEWAACFKRDRYELEMMAEPAPRMLSRQQVAKLKNVWERFKDKDEWETVEELHKLPEWKKFYAGKETVTTIPWAEVLREMGHADMVADVERDEADRKVFDEVFGE
jgi:uncharacterized phage-associated protein